MRQIFTCFLLVICFSFAGVQAQPPVKILFIGNSFTAANDLQMLVQQFFINDGMPAHTEAYAPGGISVGDVHMGTYAHMNNPVVFDMLKSTNWDYVVLQDNQGRFALDSARFPNPALSKVVEGHLKIRDSLQYYHPCAKMIWFSGWGFESEAVSMIDSITTNYRVLNDSAKDVIAPIGPAWRDIVLTRPDLRLWSPDGAHPDMTGSYLTAAVIYGTISGRDVTLNPFMYGIPPHEAIAFKTAAQRALTDPDIRLKSNLEGINPIDITWTDPELRVAAPGFTEYRWYMGNVLQAVTTRESWEPSKSGVYRVWAKDPMGYWKKSCSLPVTVPVNIQEPSFAPLYDISVYPNPAADVFSVRANTSAEMRTVDIFDLTGHRVLSQSYDSPVRQANIGVEHLADGLYNLRIESASGVHHTIIQVRH